MSLYGIADLHLPGGDDKSMEVFGDHWKNHMQKIKKYCIDNLQDDDIILIPGDLSWAMQLPQAVEDLMEIASLPGKKVLLRGNHDYWWAGIGKIRSLLPKNCYALQNDAILLDEIAICGTRSWNIPTSTQSLSPEDNKILQRELCRLELSIKKMMAFKGAKKRIVLLHFPPCFAENTQSPIVELLKQYPIDHVLYGHLHGASANLGFQGELHGAMYHLVSCDYLNFIPKKII